MKPVHLNHQKIKKAAMALTFILGLFLPMVTLPAPSFTQSVSTEVSLEASTATIPAFEIITRVEADYLRLEDLARIPGLTLTAHPSRDLKTLKIGTQQFFIMPSADGRLNVLDATGRETWHSAFRENGADYVERDFLVTIGQSALLEKPANGTPEPEQPAATANSEPELAAPLLASAENSLPMVPSANTPAENEGQAAITTNAAEAVTAPADIPVLCYHHLLLEAEMSPLQKINAAIVSVEKFERDMAYLKSKGVTTLTMAQLQAHLKGTWTAPENSVVITFDDGYQSVYRYAYPILKKYGFTASMFVVTGTVEAAPVAWDPSKTVKISWAEMNKAKNVFEYHPHSHALHGLSSSGVPLALALDEISLKADLQMATGLLTDKGFNKTRVYAHPYGVHDARADQVLNGFGYVMAFALGDAPASASDVPFALKRYGVFPYTGTGSFDRMLER
ncbi:MAG: polysaccharide deacetylase family protein [Acidaminobacter sp.]|uniref:polysaccharide deacetylase family protein n=1 Tax=Acidaminobacter sp. TaxID=1872102 RepID=UPI00137E5112|nr:polysaccharide deacetylase family protein [Acidaminobacter sp.]MZQ98012.1 polysaccharide deacetylase family protein [Acidaminobacter sp.]